jgi:flagellar biogenesis protein FliO
MASATGVMEIRGSYLRRALHRLAALCRGWGSHPSRRLRLSETLALGERRFVAVVEFERQKFLIGGTGNSVAMLTALPGAEMDSQNQTPAPVRQLANGQERGNDHDEVPTWGFAGDGPVVEMIRK